MKILALACTELVRFLRRIDAPWALTMHALLGAVPLGFVLTPSHLEPGTFDTDQRLLAVEVLRSVLALAEIAILAALAQAMAATSLGQEMRTGSWHLLVQSPTPASQALAGKGLGAFACVVMAHSAFLLALLATTPLVCRSGASVAFEALVPVLAAAAMIPAGLAEARVRATGRRYAAFRTVNVLQWASPVVLLAALLPGTTAQARLDSIQAFLAAAARVPLLTVLRETLPAPGVFVASAALLQIAFALVTWRAFVLPESTT